MHKNIFAVCLAFLLLAGCSNGNSAKQSSSTNNTFHTNNVTNNTSNIIESTVAYLPNLYNNQILLFSVDNLSRQFTYLSKITAPTEYYLANSWYPYSISFNNGFAYVPTFVRDFGGSILVYKESDNQLVYDRSIQVSAPPMFESDNSNLWVPFSITFNRGYAYIVNRNLDYESLTLFQYKVQASGGLTYMSAIPAPKSFGRTAIPNSLLIIGGNLYRTKDSSGVIYQYSLNEFGYPTYEKEYVLNDDNYPVDIAMRKNIANNKTYVYVTGYNDTNPELSTIWKYEYEESTGNLSNPNSCVDIRPWASQDLNITFHGDYAYLSDRYASAFPSVWKYRVNANGDLVDEQPESFSDYTTEPGIGKITFH